MSDQAPLLIGVDGGATEIKAHAVNCHESGRSTAFELRPESAARIYPRVAEFTPVPVAEQFGQRDAGNVQLTAAEIEQGRKWVRAAAEAIVEVARACGARRVLVGIGMPGLKTPDGRGIGVINNGPRIPEYLEALEQTLEADGVGLVCPVAALGSDADYCGLGEEHAADGLFRGVTQAYYAGCGTGIADAMKLEGQLVTFDAAKPWMMKAWQIPSALGPTFEKLVSAQSLNRVYCGLLPRATVSDAGTSATSYPEAAAAAGHATARTWLDTAALVLAELIFERLWTIKNGRADAPHRGEAYARLSPDHAYHGVLLDRVVIGQRLGLIHAAPEYHAVFRDRLDAHLAALLAGCDDAELRRTYLVDQGGAAGGLVLRPGFVQASRLRAAPALGAAVAAVQAVRD